MSEVKLWLLGARREGFWVSGSSVSVKGGLGVAGRGVRVWGGDSSAVHSIPQPIHWPQRANDSPHIFCKLYSFRQIERFPLNSTFTRIRFNKGGKEGSSAEEGLVAARLAGRNAPPSLPGHRAAAALACCHVLRAQVWQAGPGGITQGVCPPERGSSTWQAG